MSHYPKVIDRGRMVTWEVVPDEDGVFLKGYLRAKDAHGSFFAVVDMRKVERLVHASRERDRKRRTACLPLTSCRPSGERLLRR